MNEIVPAILPTNTRDLEDKLALVPEEIGLIHLDVLEEDIWTEKITIGFEVHLMVGEPERIVEKWVSRGAKNIVVHEFSQKIKDLKGQTQIGLAVELDTPLEEVFPLIPKVDFVHLMSIAQIGAQGRPLDEKIFDRIKKVRERFPQLTIGVDGGVKHTNFEMLKNLGANKFVVGSGFNDLWKSLTKK